MYKFFVNDKYEFELTDEQVQQDIVEYENNRFHVMFNNRSYNAELLEVDSSSKTLSIKVNNTIYSIKAEDEYDRLLKKLGFSDMNSRKVSQLKAPMPGLVLKVPVEVGQEIAKDDTLLILEAMKMENVVKSPTAGKIKQVKIKEGDAVNKGQVLIEFE